MDTKGFKLQQTAAKFSANIIWLLFYLFVKISCLREQPDFRGVVNAAVSRRPLQDCRKFWCFPATHKLINYFLLKFFGFQPKRTAIKFSANIIWLLFYLFVGNPCLRGTPGCGASKTLRRQHCGVALPPTRLQKIFVLSGYVQT